MNDSDLTPSERSALDQLGSRIAAAAEADTQSRARRTRRRIRVGATVAAAGAVAVAVFLAFAISPRGASRLTVDSAIASIAETAALNNAPPADKYVYSRALASVQARRTRAQHGPRGVAVGENYQVFQEVRSWQSVTRPTVIQNVFFNGVSPAVRSKSIQSPEIVDYYYFAGKRYTYEEMQALDRDPRPLINSINSQIAEFPDDEQTLKKWNSLVEPMRSYVPPLPPHVRSALISELDTLPGIKIVPDVKSGDGTKVEAFSVNTNGVRLVAWFDQSDATLRFTNATALRRGAALYMKLNSKRGDVLDSYRLLETKLVDSAPKADLIPTPQPQTRRGR